MVASWVVLGLVALFFARLGYEHWAHARRERERLAHAALMEARAREREARMAEQAAARERMARERKDDRARATAALTRITREAALVRALAPMVAHPCGS